MSASDYLIRSRVPGVNGYGAPFNDLLDRLTTTIHRSFGQGTESLRFPPVMPRANLERIGYFRNFPNLLGLVSCFCGDEHVHRTLLRIRDEGGDWTSAHAPSDLVLTPAACYPVYPALAARGAVPPDGYTIEVRSYCFRREPSTKPTRLQSFEMHEFVRVGSREQVLAFRSDWIERGQSFFAGLGLPARIMVASDPFFGRAAGVMEREQREQELKYELLVSINDDDEPTACMSFNYHRDHFGRAFELKTADGAVVQTACVGFGLARIVLALLRRHGLTLSEWPTSTLEFLGVQA